MSMILWTSPMLSYTDYYDSEKNVQEVWKDQVV